VVSEKHVGEVTSYSLPSFAYALRLTPGVEQHIIEQDPEYVLR
jgi:hypothetical protein